MSDDVTTQLPPADELFEVRDRIKALTERERFLRNLMITDPTARTGNRYAAEVKDVSTNRTDLVEMRKEHPALVEEFTYPVIQKNVSLRGISEDGELISLRRRNPRETPDAE